MKGVAREVDSAASDEGGKLQTLELASESVKGGEGSGPQDWNHLNVGEKLKSFWETDMASRAS